MSKYNKRTSNLPSMKVPKRLGPSTETDSKCVGFGCGKTVNPTFCYTGSALVGTMISEKTSTSHTPIEAVFVSHEGIEFIGGDQVQSKRTVSFPRYVKGLICTECAANYRMYTTTNQRTGEQKHYPYIKTDARPGYIGQQVQVSAKGFDQSGDGEDRGTQRGISFNESWGVHNKR